MSFSEFTPKDYEIIKEEYALLRLAAEKRCSSEAELAVVQKAFEFANEAHKNVRRRSGEPYILHPIAVAKIVVNDIGLGYKSIAAALLHDVVEDTDYTVDDIRNLFGEKISYLVDGLTKIKTVLDNEDRNKQNDIYSESLQAENFKRILLTLNDDVRVVLIKLADRLHNCRTIEYMPEHKRDKILSETMFIFIPLAGRLGLYGVKTEMENIWLRYKEPDAYKEISEKISHNVTNREEEIENFVTPIEDSLRKAGFDFEIKKRIKTPYSVWSKMQTKHIPFEQVYDLYAIRIIFTPDMNSQESERDQCYHVFSIITSLYRYKPDRLRDWVKHPKTNGYEALHCTLLSNAGMWIEVQIRTRRMDDIAEKGIAAHWVYKKNGYISENDSEMDKWLRQIKGILVNPDVNALELLDIIHNDLTSTGILVFTPKGEQKSIQKGATALDFAYLIHTEIGNKAIAAKINMKLVPLSETLRTGDQIEIITAENEHPKREWLQFLQTRRAKSIVMDYFKGERQKTVAFGKTTLVNQLDALGAKLDDNTKKLLMTSFRINSEDDLYFKIGMGIVKLDNLSEILSKSPEKSSWLRKIILRRALEKSPRADSLVLNASGDGTKFVIAQCCKPLPGDPVIGFKSPEDGLVTVHKKSCSVAEELATKHGDWVIVPQWAKSGDDTSYTVRLLLTGIDRVGLLNEISRYVSLVMGVNIRGMNIATEEGIFKGYIDINVNSKDILEKVIKRLSSIEGIQSVIRTEI